MIPLTEFLIKYFLFESLFKIYEVYSFTIYVYERVILILVLISKEET